MNILNHIKCNWKSALSVALVSVPLSLALGIASGASPVQGIITAIWAGLIAGVFGGSNFNIVGPAGALSGILMAITLLYGPGILPFVAIIAGIMTLIVWALKWDKYLIFVPSSVVHGFTLGVAFTIAFGQLNSVLGLRAADLPKHESLISNIIESFKHIGSMQVGAFLAFLIGLGIMFAVLKWKPRWPNAIVVAILGIVFGYAATKGILPFNVITLGSLYPDLSLNLFAVPSLSSLTADGAFGALSRTSQIATLLRFGGVVAFVVVLETLISAKVADGMTKTKFNQRKEVLGVGLANIVSGFFGGLPASGVFARTAINVKTGARSNWSQILNAFGVALIAFVLLPGFKYIPMSIVAAILVYASIRMVGAEHFQKLYKFDRTAFWIAMVVAILTVVYDATAGILAGTLVALLVFAKKISVAQCNITTNTLDGVVEQENMGGEAIVYRFAGELTYINAKSHLIRLQDIQAKDKALILNFRNLFYIDVDGLEALDEAFEVFERNNQSVFITGVEEHLLKFFKEHTWFNKLVEEQRVLSTTHQAVHQAVSLKSL